MVNEKGGFGDVPKPKKARQPPPRNTPVNQGTQAPSVVQSASAGKRKPSADDVLARAGIKPTSNYREVSELIPKAEEVQDGPGWLSTVPVETQNKIEQALIAAAGVTLLFFLSCGIAVCAESYILITKASAPQIVLDVISKLTPVFTPSLGIFLLCSVSLGLFKQAQFSDPGVPIGYREEDE